MSSLLNQRIHTPLDGPDRTLMPQQVELLQRQGADQLYILLQGATGPIA